jgi:hypothetical protein
LAFGLLAARGLLSDRLEHSDPPERVGVLAAICRFLRISKASRMGSLVALGSAESGFLWLRGSIEAIGASFH